MRATYIYHSGFSVDTGNALLIFDYYRGELPDAASMPADKTVYFFVSHHHADHYNPDIFSFAGAHRNTRYIIPRQIRFIPDGIDAVYVRPDEEITPDDNGAVIKIKTLRSTDSGVAYLVAVKDKTNGGDEIIKTIYHAGDLHLWIWEEATATENAAMTSAFCRELDKIKNVKIDLAFLPLDPRQGSLGGRGFDYTLRTLDIGCAVPMHFWEDADYVAAFAASGDSREHIAVMTEPGDTVEI